MILQLFAINDDKLTSFTFNHADQVDEYGKSTGDYQIVQGNFDSRATELQVKHNALIDTIQALTGSLQIGHTSASVAAETVGDALEENRLVADAKTSVDDVLTKTNATPYTPTLDYHPATKKLVDDTAISGMPLYNPLEFYQVDATGTTTQGSTLPTDNAKGVNQSLNPIVPSSVASQLITVYPPSVSDKKFTLDIQTTVTGGPITISRDGAGALPLELPDGTAIEELSQDTRFFDIVEDTSAFILAPKGGETPTTLSPLWSKNNNLIGVSNPITDTMSYHDGSKVICAYTSGSGIRFAEINPKDGEVINADIGGLEVAITGSGSGMWHDGASGFLMLTSGSVLYHFDGLDFTSPDWSISDMFGFSGIKDYDVDNNRFCYITTTGYAKIINAQTGAVLFVSANTVTPAAQTNNNFTVVTNLYYVFVTGQYLKVILKSNFTEYASVDVSAFVSYSTQTSVIYDFFDGGDKIIVADYKLEVSPTGFSIVISEPTLYGRVLMALTEKYVYDYNGSAYYNKRDRLTLESYGKAPVYYPAFKGTSKMQKQTAKGHLYSTTANLFKLTVGE